MIYNPFEVLLQTESMCREIYGILENNGERPDLAVWYQDRTRPAILILCMYNIGTTAVKELFAAGYHISFFANDCGAVELWLSK